MKTLADRLTEALDETGKTKADLARACGVAAPSVNDWFTGKTKSLKGTSLIRAAAFLQVRTMWLAEGKGPKRDSDAHADAVEPVLTWPFPTVSLDDIARLSDSDRRDLETTIKRFVAGCLAQ